MRAGAGPRHRTPYSHRTRGGRCSGSGPNALQHDSRLSGRDCPSRDRTGRFGQRAGGHPRRARNAIPDHDCPSPGGTDRAHARIDP